MALHDNPLWILSHIQNSFVVSDSTGNSEIVLTEDKKGQLLQLAKRDPNASELYLEKGLLNPNDITEETEDEDPLSRSLEIRIGRNPLRPRCNTERKLEKLKSDRSKQIDVRTVSWKDPLPSIDLSTLEDIFPKKLKIEKESERSQLAKPARKESLLSQKIETLPQLEENPFADFSRFDTTDKPPAESILIRAFLTALQATSEGKHNYLEGKIHPNTIVRDVIGFLCWKYVNEQQEPVLKSHNVDSFSLYLADSDGSIEWELRPIDKLEPISKFGFSDYALVNNNAEDETDTAVLDVKITLPDGTYTVLPLPSRDIIAKNVIDKAMARHKFRQRSGVTYTYFLEPKSTPGKALEPTQTLHAVDDIEFFIVRENSRRCAEFEPSDQTKFLEFYAMDAATYQEYRDVWLITKIRSKMAVVLAISQDKFDIFPHQTPSGRIWAAAHSIPKEGSFNMEAIVACEITEKSDDVEDLWTFRILLEHKPGSYKKVYFQAIKDTVLEIDSKVSHLLQWHSSQARSNYIVYKELKSRRRKTNIF